MCAGMQEWLPARHCPIEHKYYNIIILNYTRPSLSLSLYITIYTFIYAFQTPNLGQVMHVLEGPKKYQKATRQGRSVQLLTVVLGAMGTTRGAIHNLPAPCKTPLIHNEARAALGKRQWALPGASMHVIQMQVCKYACNQIQVCVSENQMNERHE